MNRSNISLLGRQLVNAPHDSSAARADASSYAPNASYKSFHRPGPSMDEPGYGTQARWRADPQRNTLWNWSHTPAGARQLAKKDLRDIDESIRLKWAIDVSQLGVLTTQQQASLLRSRDVRERRSAARILGIMGVSAAAQAEHLVHAILDGDEQVRTSAIWALGQLGPTVASRSKAFLSNLHPTSEQMCNIVSQVGAMLDKVSARDARQQPRKEQQDFRFTRANGLRPALQEKSFSAPDMQVKNWIPNLEERLKLVRQELNSDNPAVRHTSLKVVQSVKVEAIPMPPWELASQLARMFVDADERVRQEAARALAKMTQAAGSHLAHRVTDSDVQVRREAMSSLLDIGAGAAPHVDAIHRRLKDSDAQVRANAALSLKAIGVVSPAMESHLCKGYREDRDPVVRRCNKSALETVLQPRDKMTWRRKQDDPRALLQRWMDKSPYK